MTLARFTDQEIVAARGPRNHLDPRRPYQYLVEPECSADGIVEDVATLFLTNRECRFRCLMCDLWKNTTQTPVAAGAIPEQIRYALERLPSAQHVKLYNSGNFFDRGAIPREDYRTIAALVAPFKTVIVENHPNLCRRECLQFRDLLEGQFEVALGLETVHPQVLPALNKRMTLDDFRRAVELLVAHRVHVRAFILLRPPWLSEVEGVEWALRSIEFAFELGVRCCSVIPTRDGNGIMERLAAAGHFAPPRLKSLEVVLEAGLNLQRGRVFVDLWDANRFARCPHCAAPRIERLQRMNLQQVVEPPWVCPEDCREVQ